MEKLTISLFALALALSVNAQKLFSVMASTSATKGSTAIASGDVLNAGESITVSNGGYLALIHVSGSTLELKEAGTFTSDALAQKLTTSSDGFASKYADFVMSNIAATSADGHNYDVTGSVHRGSSQDLALIAPSHIDMVKEIPAKLSWNKVGNHTQYVVYVLNLFSEPMFIKEVSDTTVMLDLSNTELADTTKYLIQVKTKDESYESDPSAVVLGVKSSQDSQSIKTMVSRLSNELDSNSPIDNMVLASFYDSKGMRLNAENSLRTAVQLAPGVKDFERSYTKYMVNNRASGFGY